MSASWTAYVVGPFYTLLPKRWREREHAGAGKYLARAAMASGLAEAFIALVVLWFWFIYYVGTLGDHYPAFSLTSGQFAFRSLELSGETAFLTFMVNPATWVVCYFGLEGIVRTFGALTTGEVVGTLPLYIADSAWRFTQRKRAAAELPLVADEITPGGKICDIQIASCRRREGWKYPFTLRYAGVYFQVIAEKCITVGPRPYVYSLRRLPAGEIASGLHNYDPSDVLRPVHKIQPI
ncbi:MAG TPA: hypothetical protein VMB47_10920 [Candidatus Aquilonibacter sp.]|nr:hypothetical protein [Candidatus Aquilonibacter sp.]